MAARYGSWRSPLSAPIVARGGVWVDAVSLRGDAVWWLEGRPTEDGRTVLVRRRDGQEPEDVTPPAFNVRTRVHEYGGGAYLVHGETVFFANFEDQRLYRQDIPGEPRPITPDPADGSLRYADMRVIDDGKRMLCVREQHDGGDVTNEIVSLPTDGDGDAVVLATGRDFYSSPRPRPDGMLAWLEWDHPNMPWDGTELMVGRIGPEGIEDARRVAGGLDESIFQPEWGPDGRLYLCSDRTGWWNPYVLDLAQDEARPLLAAEAEFGWPQWEFGMATFGFLGDGRILTSSLRDGTSRIGVLDPAGVRYDELPIPFDFVGDTVSVDGDRFAIIASGGTDTPSVVVGDIRRGQVEVVSRSASLDLDQTWISRPQPIRFPTEDGDAHAFLYLPTNPEVEPPADERPPLLVLTHGGPTGFSPPLLRPEVQFWTTRGFAVVDVNYGGSTGYGRAYRERLKGRWGIVDVRDCIAAARHLADTGVVDRDRLAIRGGSAGGYTTLAALTFHDVFAAGASYYGVADLEALAKDTHKFESRYLDGLVGPYPDARDVYLARAPISAVDRLSAPLILFQGLDDPVVPPSQAEMMVEALERKGIPYAYLAFEGEQHGFRKAETVARCLEAELYFYSRIFGFDLPEHVEPVEIKNL